MKIAIVAAEINPYAKAGGLGDVMAALPPAMREAGADASLILPGYRSLQENLPARLVADDLDVSVGPKTERFRIFEVQADAPAPIYLIDHPEFFGRAGVYGEGGRIYPDNLLRFIFFGRAAAVAASELIRPDVVHAHDWHAAMAPIAMRADPAIAAACVRMLTIFTIHNLAFQGIFPGEDFGLLNLDQSYYSIQCLEFYGQVNLMKGAIMLADGVSTVSPSYATEISSDPQLGFGLEGVLRTRGENFTGILNGADYAEWNPATDPQIVAQYDRRHPAGKQKCTRDLRDRCGLPQREGAMLIGIVARMTAQKGADLLRDALEGLMRLNVQLVMLSGGDPGLEAFFTVAQDRYPGQLRVLTAFDSVLAHKIQAGSDAFLMPSQFEPCGLTQMYALKYGTAPIVRATGGLKDTITEFDTRSGSGNGFVFSEYGVEALVGAVDRALDVYRDPPRWRRLMANCFESDFPWSRSAQQYLDWFARLRTQRLPN